MEIVVMRQATATASAYSALHVLTNRQRNHPDTRPSHPDILSTSFTSRTSRIRHIALFSPDRTQLDSARANTAVFEEYRPIWAGGVLGGAVWRGGRDCSGVLQVCDIHHILHGGRGRSFCLDPQCQLRGLWLSQVVLGAEGSDSIAAG